MYSKRKYGGKGNFGMYIDHYDKVCAAGMPTLQPEENVKKTLGHYCLQDEVDALIGDAIYPSNKHLKLPPLKDPKIRDMRNAGIFSEGSQLINPPVKTKFQTLVEDFKTTAYNSYWNKEVGKVPDPTRSLPEGFKMADTVAKKTIQENLYDVILPVKTLPDMTPISQQPGYQIDRNYCLFNPNLIFGHKTNSNRSGALVKCCLTDEKIYLGTSMKTPISEKQAGYQNSSTAKLGIASAPNDNINYVPEGFAFGKLKPPDNLPECLRDCEINPNKELILRSLEHLNTVRKCLAKRYNSSFFYNFYLYLKFLDSLRTGWLDKDIIYKECNNRYIRFNPSLIEPLLSTWQAFDGTRIEYKTFVHVINYREPSPNLPKIQDIPNEYINFLTTYKDMVDYKDIDKMQLRAGLPSGRYFDKAYPVTPPSYCKADNIYLPEESDMKACLCPSILGLLGISHRDMYANRDPQTIRKLFENAGEQFNDEKFQSIWKIAQKRHSKGWVCFETFRESLIEYDNNEKVKKS